MSFSQENNPSKQSWLQASTAEDLSTAPTPVANVAPKPKTQKPPHAGHRSRLVAKSAREDLGDTELLELFLFNAIPRRNTNDIAHRLLRKFGSLYAVANASAEELKQVVGVGDSVVLLIRNLKRFCERYNNPDLPLPKAYANRDFWEFLENTYKLEMQEVMDLYLLDEYEWVFKTMRIATGDEKAVDVAPQAVSKALIEFRPKGMVLVHNHPTGLCEPSDSDKSVTKSCQLICSMHNVKFCDHVIYGTDGRYSFYDSGKMQKISIDYSVARLVREKGGYDVE